MSDTPRTDDAMWHQRIPGNPVGADVTAASFSAGIERELAAAQDQVLFLRQAIAEQNLEIEQICGKVLGYPWFKDDQKNFPGSTEKDGVCIGEHVAETVVAELARKFVNQQTQIQRLVDAGDEMAIRIGCGCDFNGCGMCQLAEKNWTAAKEEKL